MDRDWFRTIVVCATFIAAIPVMPYTKWAFVIGVCFMVVYACGEMAIANEAKKREAKKAAKKPQLIIPPFAGK